MNKLRVLVLMGGKSPEYKVSLISGRQVVSNLDKDKYQVSSFVIPQKGDFDFSSFKKLNPDIVFIAMHGPFGEDGSIQGMLEFLGVPYVGAGVLASALGMNKIMFRKIIEKEGVPVPKYLVFGKNENPEKILDIFEFPLVVKPSQQGSSIGVSIVDDKSSLERSLKMAFEYDNPIIIEEFLSGQEITCGIIGNDDYQILPLVEIKSKRRFFDYQAKYSEGECEEIVPAKLPVEISEIVKKTALKVYRSINCQVFGRVDLILVDGVPYVLEINTIPGLTPISLLPKAALAAGLTYSQLLDVLIDYSFKKC